MFFFFFLLFLGLQLNLGLVVFRGHSWPVSVRSSSKQIVACLSHTIKVSSIQNQETYSWQLPVPSRARTRRPKLNLESLIIEWSLQSVLLNCNCNLVNINQDEKEEEEEDLLHVKIANHIFNIRHLCVCVSLWQLSIDYDHVVLVVL